jgi:RimJ/RimL family protein N-acetyltransferase
VDTTEITAGRLHLRPWVPYDAGDVFEACQDPEIPRWTPIPSPYTREDARVFVEETAPQGWESGTAATWAVLDATTGGLLAAVGLYGINETHRSAEVGYWTAAPARGGGVTAEAVGTVCRWGFGVLGLQRVACVVAVENRASQRVATRAGFAYEGVMRNGMRLKSGQTDAWLASLLPTD